MSSSSIINENAEKVWKTLRAFGGNESFNPLVTTSDIDGSTLSNEFKATVYEWN